MEQQGSRQEGHLVLDETQEDSGHFLPSGSPGKQLDSPFISASHTDPPKQESTQGKDISGDKDEDQTAVKQFLTPSCKGKYVNVSSVRVCLNV